MGRAFSHIALILAALALGGADHPEGNASAEKSQAAQIEQGSARIADAISKIGPEQDNGCPDGQDKRNSDLCAQWNAADAAKSAALATWLAVVLSFFGTVFIALTFWESLKTTRRELRAYISVKTESLTYDFPNRKIRATYAIKNGGQTPAYDVINGEGIVILTPEQEVGFFSQMDINNRVGEYHPYTIQHGETAYGHPEAEATFTDEGVLVIAANQSIIVYGFVEYKDTFGISRRTLFAHKAVTISPPNVEVWQIVPWHSSAT